MVLSNAKKALGATAMACAVAAGCLGGAYLYSATEASAAPANGGVMAAYKAKVDQLSGKGIESVKYADLDGNGVKELLCTYKGGDMGSGSHFDVYAYRNGKVTAVLKTGEYGLNYVKYSKKSNSFVTQCTGHGHEGYTYYKLASGKYKEVAFKGRMSKKGGNPTNGAWAYQVKGKSTGKAAFDKAVSKIQKGKVYKVSLY